MAHRLAQISWQLTTPLARDRVITTAHFKVGWSLVSASDEDALAEDLATVIKNRTPIGAEINVRVYDGDSSPMGAPVAHATRDLGGVGQGQGPREVALCLSFHDGQNKPRHRGRMYWPAGSFYNSLLQRPQATQMDSLIGLATDLANIGGTNVDWCVYSDVDNELRPVKFAWVDDEWDTQRSRGMRSTTRAFIALDE